MLVVEMLLKLDDVFVIVYAIVGLIYSDYGTGEDTKWAGKHFLLHIIIYCFELLKVPHKTLYLLITDPESLVMQ